MDLVNTIQYITVTLSKYMNTKLTFIINRDYRKVTKIKCFRLLYRLACSKRESEPLRNAVSVRCPLWEDCGRLSLQMSQGEPITRNIRMNGTKAYL